MIPQKKSIVQRAMLFFWQGQETREIVPVRLRTGAANIGANGGDFASRACRGTGFRILPVRKAASSDGRCFYFGCGGKHEKPWQSACGLARQTSAPTAAILCSAPARDLVQNPPAPARKQEKLKARRRWFIVVRLQER